MRRILFACFLIVIGSMLVSCNDKDSIEYEGQFDESLSIFGKFKESSGNSYVYTTSGGSWMGVSWETEITVYEGEVIRRSFKYTQIGDGIEIPEEQREWTEEGAQIGQTDSPASAAITLDEIYENAKNEWLRKRKNTQIFFETENDGMISSCGYVPKDCVDDCFTGINIIKIEATVLR